MYIIVVTNVEATVDDLEYKVGDGGPNAPAVVLIFFFFNVVILIGGAILKKYLQLRMNF